MTSAMIQLREAVKSITPIRRALTKRRMARGVAGQSDEGRILRQLVDEGGTPRTFVEFGFHPAEYNCASLVTDHAGLLIDGSAYQIADARALLPKTLRIEQRFLTLDNLDFIDAAFPEIGVLSIDVDGNDYWFLKALLPLKPAIICVEYNGSFGQHPVTVPYDPSFDRHDKHASGWYHGASLSALTTLVAAHGYGLAKIAEAGGNAFFTRTGTLDPRTAWKPTAIRDASSGSSAAAQWDIIKHMPFVDVSRPDLPVDAFA
ncbi:hypothetical protein KZX46_14725 [Polymorphobacter sp. PAMC 29334]|uniref:hypothetical protein n=1 Tax=Polymorphobacter sp. PAMC 29334 TaxID=2862331 RepID=UPI001C752153|nr:hypothetical protein [Polymorphobacter sp. PAMC 29334]QYE34053.1 hypothetical protein KZX46_14725 [Polymorphobacter sp. PAMC 29334]